MRNISTLLSLATIVVACSIIYNTEKVSGQCGGSVPALISECGQYVQKSGPKVPPSAECCSELLKLDVPCACNFVTKDVVNLISVPKALFIAHYCGMKLTPGMQCGGKYRKIFGYSNNIGILVFLAVNYKIYIIYFNS
ncbi:hypothetical protein AHAS_Ahas13G0102700 [Arachis hypogaea]